MPEKDHDIRHADKAYLAMLLDFALKDDTDEENKKVEEKRAEQADDGD